mmetsp:Transcript_45996/g.68467  ORF Transcript_45996/g.68467 Transcript_45996/m.68467 type:complete len:154 (-) Transcript_45996:42-503(-)
MAMTCAEECRIHNNSLSLSLVGRGWIFGGGSTVTSAFLLFVSEVGATVAIIKRDDDEEREDGLHMKVFENNDDDVALILPPFGTKLATRWTIIMAADNMATEDMMLLIAKKLNLISLSLSLVSSLILMLLYFHRFAINDSFEREKQQRWKEQR